jgi:hypothetical protein
VKREELLERFRKLPSVDREAFLRDVRGEETRTEYRVVIDFPDGGMIAYSVMGLEEAKQVASAERQSGPNPVRIERRTLTVSPWTDLPEQEGR